MEKMFNGCFSLSSFPYISKWNMNEVGNIQGMFCGCLSTSSIPNIFKKEILSKYNPSAIFGKNISSINTINH
jgi:hypothetical protein